MPNGSLASGITEPPWSCAKKVTAQDAAARMKYGVFSANNPAMGAWRRCKGQ